MASNPRLCGVPKRCCVAGRLYLPPIPGPENAAVLPVYGEGALPLLLCLREYVLASSYWRALTACSVQETSSRHPVNMQACSEFQLFEGVVDWAQQREYDGEVTDALTELLPLIRFPIMLPQELQVPYLLSHVWSWSLNLILKMAKQWLCSRTHPLLLQCC